MPRQPSLPFNRNDRIQLLWMPDDPDPLPEGATGTITSVGPDMQGSRQYGVQWDKPHEQRTLMLCIPPDSVRRI